MPANWRWVLFINAPIGVAVLAGTGLGVLVPGDTERGELDLLGVVTATAGTAALSYALTRGGSDGWSDLGTIAAFGIGVVLLLAFAVAERRVRAPMLPAGLLRDRNRGGANLVTLLLGTGMLAMYYLLTGRRAHRRRRPGLDRRAADPGIELLRGTAPCLLNTSTQCGAALGLAALAAIASAVTGSQQAGHAHAVALTHGYVAGLLAGAVSYAAAAVVAALTINARLSSDDLAAATSSRSPRSSRLRQGGSPRLRRSISGSAS